MKNATCRCGKGKVSAYDNKCGHCRSRKEQWAHVQGLLQRSKPNGRQAQEFLRVVTETEARKT
jgi:hypothetical protein